MKLHINISVTLDTVIDPDDGYYRFKSTNPIEIRKELEERLSRSRRDLFEEITCAGRYNVEVR